MVDPALRDGQERLVGMRERSATVFPPVVGKHALDLDPLLFVEQQHAVVEHIDSRHGQLRQVKLGEGQRAVRVQYRLHVDLAHALDGACEVGVLAEQEARLRRLHTRLAIREPTTIATQQAELRLAQYPAPPSSVPAAAGAGSAASSQAVARRSALPSVRP